MNSKKKLQVLDCTLRDGGSAIDFNFGYKDVEAVVKNLNDAGVDIIELGFLKLEDKSSSVFSSIEEMSNIIPKSHVDSTLFTGMITYPAFPIEKIPERKDSYIDAIRVIIRYSDLLGSINFCKQVAKKGYLVFVQPAITVRYTLQALQMLFDAANEIGVYSLYIVDSYGYMGEQDLIDYLKIFDKSLNDSIRIGFHSHNNMNLAFSNALAFINYQTSRRMTVDSCLLGMGDGAGNLQTELFIDHLNKNVGAVYNYDKILEACEIIEKYFVNIPWGYSIVNLLSSINKTSYKYSKFLRNEYFLPFTEIDFILRNIPEDIRHRYTPENALRLLDLAKAKLMDSMV